MTLYIIRHADPDYENNTITDFGKEEAKALAEWFKDRKIDKIYTSPLGRAIDTAKPTCEIKGLDYTILPWTEESMDYMLSFKFTPETDCSYSCSVKEGVHDFVDFTGTERMKTVDKMIAESDNFLASLGYRRKGLLYTIEDPNDDVIAVFCHGGFGSAWITHLLGCAPGMMWPGIALNTSSVTTFEFRNEEKGFTRPILHRMGEIAHIYDAGLRVNNR
ncbi:MAG: histidine phosphatase family protein [Clostridia bacterium]|nr:histidine phosphatase family protein [Clostridia bacterium]MBO4453163.1 histidine phosphatase family protein [Clostridia bacterium]